MLRIGLISDSHGDIPDDVRLHLEHCDEVWHAGDIGPVQLEDILHPNQICRAVYGNIDDSNIRAQWPENQLFEIDGLKVLITHIGGYPPRYSKRVRQLLDEVSPNLYICGHSHILKVMPDRSRKLLHMNPGACGHKGFHSIRTMLLFDINAGVIENVRAVELGPRGRSKR